MSLLIAFTSAFVALAPLPSDTPPTPPSIAAIEAMSSEQDVVALARLADGSKAPAQLRLPTTANTSEVFDYLVQNYPPHRRDAGAPRVGYVWMLVSEAGRVADVQLLKGTGDAAFDSLALRVLTVFRFTPASLDAKAVAVWVAFPVQIGPYEQLASRLDREAADCKEPCFTPYTTKPELINRADVSQALVRAYPVSLRNKGIGGTTMVWLYVDAEGKTAKTAAKNSSGYPELDQAALQVAGIMRWTPALNGTRKVPVWIALPIVFGSK